MCNSLSSQAKKPAVSTVPFLFAEYGEDTYNKLQGSHVTSGHTYLIYVLKHK